MRGRGGLEREAGSVNLLSPEKAGGMARGREDGYLDYTHADIHPELRRPLTRSGRGAGWLVGRRVPWGTYSLAFERERLRVFSI